MRIFDHHNVNTLHATFQRSRLHWLLGGLSLYPKSKHAEVGCYAYEIALACLVGTFGQRLPSVATFGHGILLPADEKLNYPFTDSHQVKISKGITSSLSTLRIRNEPSS